MKFIIFAFLLLMFSKAVVADSSRVEQVVSALRALCLAGESFELEVTGDGKLSLLKLGGKGKIVFSKTERRGVVDGLFDNQKLRELENIRDCIEPRIDRVLDYILNENSSPDEAGLSKVNSGIFRDTLGDGSKGPEMVVVSPGSFMMGASENDKWASSSEQPQHRVIIKKPYAIGMYEVTVGQFKKFVGTTGYKTDVERHFFSRCHEHVKDSWLFNFITDNDGTWLEPGYKQDNDYPVVCVSKSDAQSYVDWLSSETGGKYRLPSESEWEYAARAGSSSLFYWGNFIGKNNANCDECYSSWEHSNGTSPIGSFSKNSMGLYDVHGNVAEWVKDNWHYDGYDYAPDTGAVWLGGKTGAFIVRGGSWNHKPKYVRLAARERVSKWDHGGMIQNIIGFRLAKDL